MLAFDTSIVDSLKNVLWVSREWHKELQKAHAMHPAVLAAMELCRPKDWHAIVLEYPHRSEKDATRLAYTQNEKKAESGIKTVTTVGKYLTKNFPGMQDHVIRGLVDRFNATGVEVHWTDEMIIKAVQEGPKSCMQWDDDDVESRGGHHPYECYCAAFGWGIAVRMDMGKITGRALVLDYRGKKVFVRTYLQAENGGYSQRDTQMEEWLKAQGFSHISSWPQGAKLARIEYQTSGYYRRNELLFPYIDGDNNDVRDAGDYLVIDKNGEWCCNSTNGSADEQNVRQCDDCGDRIGEDDGNYVGRYGDHCVCESCLDSSYRYAYGRRRDQSWIPEDDAVEVDGEYYATDYLCENDIVELDNGDYCKLDYAFCCPILDAWFSDDDGRYVEDKECTVHKDEAWQCVISGKWYSNDEESTTDEDGDTVHPDNVEAEEEESVVE